MTSRATAFVIGLLGAAIVAQQMQIRNLKVAVGAANLKAVAAVQLAANHDDELKAMAKRPSAAAVQSNLTAHMAETDYRFLRLCAQTGVCVVKGPE